MKYVFIKMFSTLGTIVLNIGDIFCIGLLTAYITYSYCLCIGLGIILSVELFPTFQLTIYFKVLQLRLYLSSSNYLHMSLVYKFCSTHSA